MKYKLRDYQDEAVDVILKTIEETPNPFVIQAATGAGKSLIIADVVDKLPGHTLILQPGREILQQNAEKLGLYVKESEIGIFSASLERKEIKQYTFATIQSIYKQPENFTHFDTLIIDECHLVNSKKDDTMLMKFIKASGISQIFGLTASPYRLESKTVRTSYGEYRSEQTLEMLVGANKFFKTMPFSVETGPLIERGYLANINYRNEPVPWTTLVSGSSGFTKKSIDNFERKNKITDKAIRQILQSDLIGHKTITFAASVEHAETIFLAVQGKTAVAIVTSQTKPADRAQIIYDYKEGSLRHIINYGTLTTGFDSPDITAVILARPTASPALYYQMIGRGVRQLPEGKKLLQVYDLCGNYDKYGKVEDMHVVSDGENWHLFVRGKAGTRQVDGHLLKTQIFKTPGAGLATPAQVRYLYFLASRVGEHENDQPKLFVEMTMPEAGALIDHWKGLTTNSPSARV